MDEATRKMVVEIVNKFLMFFNGCFTIWYWVYFTTIAQRTQFPRLVRFLSWFTGIAALAVFVIVGLMDTIGGYLYWWMRIVLVLGYLAALGYIIKRRSEISLRTPQ